MNRYVLAAAAIAAGFGIVPATRAGTAIGSAERSALTALYLATGGNNWIDNSNWCAGACPSSGTPTFNTPGTECTWYGVTCDASQTHVTNLRFAGDRLSGGPLPDLSALSGLLTLELENNQLTGPLPDASVFPALTVLNLSRNQFSGSIPPNLGNAATLSEFVVVQNQLSGSIPALSGLAMLKTFQVDDNQLTGTLPPLSNLPRLQLFGARSNRLSGSIPSLSGLGALALFYVNDNQLSGAPPSLAGLDNLAFFDVDQNQLSGSVTSVVGAKLGYASYAGNRLSGGFPDLSGAPLLTFLDLSYNQLSGPLPADLSATSLQNLYLEFNRFSGGLPVAPASLRAHQSMLCPNPLALGAGANDAPWANATGQTPWWGPSGSGCDSLFGGGFESLSNGSFEAGLSGWHVGSGTCLWQTAAAGDFTNGYRKWQTVAPLDGNMALMVDSQNVGDCMLYQDVIVPTGASSATLSAAAGYYATGGDPALLGCSAKLSVVTPAGVEIAPYVAYSGSTPVALTAYAPSSFSVQPGAVLRVQVTLVNRCIGYPVGFELDNVTLTLQ